MQRRDFIKSAAVAGTIAAIGRRCGFADALAEIVSSN